MTPTMASFAQANLVDSLPRGDHGYSDFFRSECLSMGMATWAAGSTDTQSPHTEEEVYYEIRGQSQFTCEGETVTVAPGSIVFVRAGAVHCFHDIVEDLQVLVFWAPPYGSRCAIPGE